MMGYQKFCYWTDLVGLERVRKNLEGRGVQLTDETQIPCRVLRSSKDIGYLTPSAWYGICKRRTSWYWESKKASQLLVVSNTSLDHLDIGNPILITESNFRPDRLPSFDETLGMIKSKDYQQRKPNTWEDVEPIEKEFYQTWFERRRANEPFDFEKIFMSHSANHSNFLDPKFFINLDGLVVPYSIADSLRVCSSCLEFFNVLGSKWSVKYVVPCIGAVLFARLPIDQYFKVNVVNGEDAEAGD